MLNEWKREVLAERIAGEIAQYGKPSLADKTLRCGQSPFQYEVRDEGVVCVYVARRLPLDRAVCAGLKLADLKKMAGLTSVAASAKTEDDK